MMRSRVYSTAPTTLDGELLLLGGASSGQSIIEFLDDLLRSDATVEEFDQLPRSLAVVAADLVSGDEVVYTSGTLTAAVGDDWGRGDLLFTVEALSGDVTARRFVMDPNGSLTELGGAEIGQELAAEGAGQKLAHIECINNSRCQYIRHIALINT